MDLGNREWYHRSAGVKTTGEKIANKKKKKINVHMLNLDTVLQPMGNVFFLHSAQCSVTNSSTGVFFSKSMGIRGPKLFCDLVHACSERY